MRRMPIRFEVTLTRKADRSWHFAIRLTFSL